MTHYLLIIALIIPTAVSIAIVLNWPLPKFWDAKFSQTEMAIALFATVLFFVPAEFFAGAEEVNRILANNREALYMTLAAIFASLLGFTITATSIVLGFLSPQINKLHIEFRVIRDSPQYSNLWKIFRSALKALAAATVAALAGLAFDRGNLPFNPLFYIMLFTFFISCLRMARVLWLLEYIIILMVKGQKRS